jgi:hypothetical protein
MIIPVSGVDTLADYVARKESLDKFRPNICPSCKREKSFWRHGKYRRFVFDGSENVAVRINRFRCSNCALVVSCLFSFMTPYARFASALICKAIENFSSFDMTYSEQASELANIESELPPKPSSTQIFRWVDLVSKKAESLLFNLQKSLLMRGAANLLLEFVSRDIPNQNNARSNDKKIRLNKLGELVQMAVFAQPNQANALQRLHAYFFCDVESLQAIFCGRSLTLPTAHNLQSRLF